MLTPFAVSAFSFYQARFILSSTFFKYFSEIFESKLSDILFCCIVFLATPDYLTRLSFAVKYFFKCFLFLSMLLFCVPICRSSGACIYYQDSSASSSTLSRTIRHIFLFVRKRVLLYLEALSLPHALEFFVFCCFSACLPLDLQ